MKRIVIVEDDPAGRELLVAMLRSWGYEVTEARNGAEALQKIGDSRPDLVVCDIHMPLLDGVGFVQALRRNRDLTDIPVIALTGVDAPDQEAIATAGFTTYQSKPVSSELLKRNLERLLHKAK